MRTLTLALALFCAAPLAAATIPVPAGQSIQAAIDAAQDGDTISVAAGEFVGDLDFVGKAVAVVGAGPTTVVHGSGNGPVVRFVSGEGAASILDSLTVTGGVADLGGGLRIIGASPTILRTVITGNRASGRGSGVYLQASTATLRNNLIAHNGNAGLGDPHSVEIDSASPSLVNNTIARGDSNGILVRGPSAPLIANNVLASNGSIVDGGRRGRGICDFSPAGTRMEYNVFFRNRVGALLTNGTDYRRIRSAQGGIGAPRLVGNVDGRPGFLDPPRRRLTEPFDANDFALGTVGSPHAVDAGNPDPAFNDRDGSRNDAGFTGGPYVRP